MKTLMSCALATAIALAACLSTPASARAVVGISVGYPPPPARIERVVVTRPGSVWIPGYWGWRSDRHVWVGGYWTRARPGYRYMPARWVAVGPRWHFHAGYWRR